MKKTLALMLFFASLAFAPPCASVDAAPSTAAKGDPVRGKAIYQQRCAMCHSIEPGKSMIGPSLAGVAGRKAGSQSYAYSSAMRAAMINWDARALIDFLEAPQKRISGTKMTVRLSNPAERADVVAFLTLGH